MLLWKKLLIALACVLLLAVGGLTFLAVLSRRPPKLGPVNGDLPPCPDSDNCVSSRATDERHRIDPIAFTTAPRQAWKSLKEAIARQPRGSVVTESDGYLHVEFRSPLFRFRDDAEFLLVPESRAIHVRSASRVGYSDLGLNRRRMEKIRKTFQELQRRAEAAP